MQRTSTFFCLLFSLILSCPTFGQGTSCQFPNLVCTNENDVFTIGINNSNTGTANPNNNYGCLATQPNPTWMQWQVTTFGGALLELKNDQELDLQVAVWGPFSGYLNTIDTCGELKTPVFCTPVARNTHYINLPIAVPGQYFLMMVTRADGSPTNLYFNEISTLGIFDCNGKIPGCGPKADDPPGCEICQPSFSSTTVNYDACCLPVPGFCSFIENNQWVNFLATDTVARINVYGFNCLYQEGIEAVVTDQNLNIVSNCFISTPGDFSDDLIATGLTPGKRYYVMVDGVNGDACEFTLNFNSGVWVGKPDSARQVIGPIDVCPGGTTNFTVDSIPGATNYHWSVPKDLATIIDGQGTRNITVRFKQTTGSGEICICPTNACYEGVAACLTVNSQPISTTTLPDTSVCSNDFPIILEGQSWDSAGTYSVVYPSYLGCDSTVQFTIINDPGCRNWTKLLLTDSILTVDSVICQSDTTTIIYHAGILNSTQLIWDFAGGIIVDGENEGPYDIYWDTPGKKEIILTIVENGDTITIKSYLEVISLPDEPIFDCQTRNVLVMQVCWDQNQTAISAITGINGTTGNLNGNCFIVSTPSDNGSTIDFEYTVQGEIPGCDLKGTHQCDITNCPPVEILPVNPGLICYQSNLTPIQLQANVLNNLSNGTFTWSGNFVSSGGLFNVASAGPGNHIISVNYEEDGCDWTEVFEIEVADQPEIFDFSIQGPLFFSETSGNLGVELVSPGNYTYEWTDPNGVVIGNSNNVRVQKWFAGQNYCVNVTNDAGCSVNECVRVGGPIFRVNPFAVICKGDGTNLTVRPGNGADFSWSPATGLSCTDCPNPFAAPSATTKYTVTARLPDGRQGSTDVWVIVLPQGFCPFALESNDIDALNAIQNPVAEVLTNQVLSSIENSALKNDLIIFPNPGSGQFNVQSNTSIDEVKVIDINGKIILIDYPNSTSTQFNLETQPQGNFFVKIRTNGIWHIKRILKM
jgi:hypothetical protein